MTEVGKMLMSLAQLSSEGKDSDPPVDAATWQSRALAEITDKSSPRTDARLTLVSSPVKIMQGRRSKLVQAAREFDISFSVQLTEVPSESSNIVHFSIDGSRHSHLPSINILGGTTRVIATLAHGIASLDICGPESGLQLGEYAHISLQLRDSTVTLNVNGHVTRKQIMLQVPSTAPLYAWVSSPYALPAAGSVGNLIYRARVGLTTGIARRSSTTLALPPREQQLLKQTREDIARNKKFAMFDAFFGFFLLVNCILIGVELENSPEDSMWTVFESVFIGIFVVEWLARLKLSGHSSLRDVLRDGWMLFDLFVIAVATVEVVLPDLPGVVGIIRLLRLMKLAKMVRLLRAFRELGILVEGLLKSWRTIAWASVLLTLVTYLGSILVVKTQQMDGTYNSNSPQQGVKTYHDFSELPSAMWRLMQLATFDNWAEAMRELTLDIGGIIGFLLAFEVFCFISFVGLGILNMVAGILCHTAFVASQRHRLLQGIHVLLVQREAMGYLRQALRTLGERPLFKSDRYISTDELFAAISGGDQDGDSFKDEDVDIDGFTDFSPLSPNMSPAKAAAILKLTGAEILGLCDTFGENGEIDIDGLIEAIGIKELQAYHSLMKSDWTSTKITSTMRPVDMVFFNFSLREVEQKLAAIDRGVTNACAMSFDTIRCLLEQSEQANTILSLEKNSAWSPPPRFDNSQPTSVNVNMLEATVKHSDLKAKEASLYTPIDVTFGALICLNGVFIGIQVSAVQKSVSLDVVDGLFTAVFAIEIVCRTFLFANVEAIEHDESLADADMLKTAEKKLDMYANLRSRMRLLIFPPVPQRGCGYALRVLPKMLSEPYTLADFVIVCISVFDTVLLSNLRRANVISADPSALTVLRIFRLFRLAKLLRVFRIFPELQMLLFALAGVWRTVLWALMLMLLVLYGFTIYTRIAFNGYPGLQHDFGTLTRSALSLWQLATFDGWGDIADHVATESPWQSVVVFIILVGLGLGLMKMIIGVMSESAISLTRQRGQEAQKEALITYIGEMAQLYRMFHDELKTDLLVQEILEHALQVKMRPRRHGQDGSQTPIRPEAMATAMSPDFALRLLRIFKKAGFSVDAVKHVFEKVDYQRRGHITIDAFVKGGIVMKEDLTRVEMFASITALRELRRKCSLVNDKLRDLHTQLDTFLQHACALINRKRYTGEQHSHRRQNQSVGALSEQAAAALKELAMWMGAVPEVQALGKLKMVTGVGKLCFEGEMAIGQGTELKKQVRSGDLIIVQIGNSPGHEQVVAMNVINVNQERLKVSPSKVKFEGPQHFLIARRNQGRTLELHPYEDKHELHCSGQLSPRSLSLLFNWELNTKRRHDSRLENLLKDKLSLVTQANELERELKALHERALAQHVFDLLKAKNSFKK